jgi:glycosyltransferase involved in cell wall biosynthesis
MPKVSVVIPTYNRADTILKAIDSVLKQTFHDFEIIIIDDGSTDKTYEIVKQINDKRIRYIRHEKNKGASSARNTGIKIAKGQYIAFQDSDDEWLPDKLEKQIVILDSSPNEVGIIYCGFWRTSSIGKIYFPPGKITKIEGDLNKDLLKGNYIGMPTVVIKKDCFIKCGNFDEELPSLEDWELFIRLAKYYEFRCINEPLVISNSMPICISKNNKAIVEAHKMILEKYIIQLNNKKLLALQYYYIGKTLCQNEDDNGKYYLLKALKLNPLNFKYILLTSLAYLDKRLYINLIKLKHNIINNKFAKECIKEFFIF